MDWVCRVECALECVFGSVNCIACAEWSVQCSVYRAVWIVLSVPSGECSGKCIGQC